MQKSKIVIYALTVIMLLAFLAPAASAESEELLYGSFASGVWTHDGEGWAGSPLTSSQASALAVHDGNLYGAFASGTWMYDGNWTKLTASQASALAVCSNGVLYASFDSGTWYYDGLWNELSSAKASALAVQDGKLYGSYGSGVHVYDISAESWSLLTASQASALAAKGAMLYGSFDSGTWSYDVDWDQLTGSKASALAVDGGQLYGAYNSGVWTYDDAGWAASPLTSSQASALAHGAVEDALEIVSVEAVTRTVEWNKTEQDALNLLPEQVEVTLEGGSTAMVMVEWDDEIPGFDGTADGTEYEVEGDLVLTPKVLNTGGYSAEATITVAARDVFFVYDEEDYEMIDAKNAQAEKIVLGNDVVINNRFVIDWTTEIDLNGFTIDLDGGMLAVTGNNVTIENGAIFGEITWWSWNGPDEIDLTDNEWDTWDEPWTATSWVDWREPFSERVMVSGDNVTFDDVDLHVDIADWYQYQGNKDATGLTIKNGSLHGLSLFVSDVTLEGNVIANRVGIEHDGAVLEENRFVDGSIPANTVVVDRTAAGAPIYHPEVAGLYGIVYVNSDAYLLNNTWADNFTGMFVGKSLKYYGDESDIPGSPGEIRGYTEVKPTVDGATIETDKYGLVWWAINHFKSELHVTGDIDMTSTPIIGGQHTGPALMLVGTCYQDYQDDDLSWPEGKIEGDYNGGEIRGDATFKGADVWFGKPTAEFLAYDTKSYEGDVYYRHDLCDKTPACIKYVDYQACKKDADRLYIHGPEWEATVHIFTPANDYH